MSDNDYLGIVVFIICAVIFVESAIEEIPYWCNFISLILLLVYILYTDGR